MKEVFKKNSPFIKSPEASVPPEVEKELADLRMKQARLKHALKEHKEAFDGKANAADSPYRDQITIEGWADKSKTEQSGTLKAAMKKLVESEQTSRLKEDARQYAIARAELLKVEARLQELEA